MITPEEYERLYRKFPDGTCTAEERQQIFSYRDEVNISQFDNASRIQDQDRIENEIYTRLRPHLIQEKTRRLFPYKYIAAASIILIAIIGLLLNRQSNLFNTGKSAHFAKRDTLIRGGNKAILTLGDQKEIDLSAIEKGTILESSGVRISKTNGGKIIYTLSSANNLPPSVHTIRTPNGGEFEVVLPDGTQVWLNAASTLKFPSRFAGLKRQVELTGEAYFEVAKNRKMPFSVITKNTEVKVLGTHFNVMAYPEDQSTETTLLEGSVQLNSKQGTLLLKPGEQGRVNSQDDITNRKVNTEDIIAWKNGYFVFRKENIKSIMAKVARWYGAEIVYDGDLENVKLGGTVSRSENISELLSRLEMTGVINFKIEGKTIYVTKTKIQ